MPYKFDQTFSNPNSYIRQYIDYCTDQTDAPHEFHEFYALSQLGIASHGLVAPKPGSSGGMQLNIYGIMHGSSAIARKSTSMDLCKELLKDAIGQSYGEADDFTPEGLLEALERNDGRAMVIYMDEFTLLLDKMVKQFMGGIKPLLLKLYASKSHKYTRTSKGTGKKKEVDEVEIKSAHLNLVGNVTQAINQRFSDIDMQDGFLGRFLIISPEGKPPSKRFRNTKNVHIYIDLVERLKAISHGCQECKEWARENNREPIEFSDDAVDTHFDFQEEIEGMIENKRITGTQFILVQRIPEYAIKIASLNALSVVDPVILSHGPLFVTVDDMREAILLARKYMGYAIKFSSDIGSGYLEGRISLIMEELRRAGGSSSRNILMKKFKILKHDMDKIEATLIARDDIFPKPVVSTGERRRTRIEWYLSNGYKAREESQPPASTSMEDATSTSAEG